MLQECSQDRCEGVCGHLNSGTTKLCGLSDFHRLCNLRSIPKLMVNTSSIQVCQIAEVSDPKGFQTFVQEPPPRSASNTWQQSVLSEIFSLHEKHRAKSRWSIMRRRLGSKTARSIRPSHLCAHIADESAPPRRSLPQRARLPSKRRAAKHRR